MPEEDYRVVYKTRQLDKDEPRPRIPTALDPYDNSYGLERFDRNRISARNSTSNLDDRSELMEVTRRSVSRSSYSPRDDGRSRENLADTRRSTRSELTPRDPRSGVRKSTIVEQRRDSPSARRSDQSLETRLNNNRESIEVEGPRGRDREYYVDDRSRSIGVPYVIETRQGDIVDVYTAPRGGSRVHEKEDRRYADSVSSPRTGLYERGYNRNRPSRLSETSRDPGLVVIERDYPQGLPYETNDRRTSRLITRDYEREREDDWRLVDSMQETRIGSAQPRENRAQSSTRSRARTYSSEDSYVMVSPTQKSQLPQQPGSSESRNIQSAMARKDRPELELRRRRSRSISFRDSGADQHDCGKQRHARPGAEAEIGGHLLSRPVADDDETSDVYGVVHAPHKDYRFSRNPDPYAATYRERDVPYAPQVGRESRRRERSRRRKHDQDDDRSYYSDNYTKTVTKQTRYV